MVLFTEAGIDQEIFKDIDEDMLKSLFTEKEPGFKKKFLNKFKTWKNLDDVINAEIVTNECNIDLESSMELTSQAFTNTQLSLENPFNSPPLTLTSNDSFLITCTYTFILLM